MHRLKPGLIFSVLFLVAAIGIRAQTEAEIESDQVKRVGTHINCQCGSCNENINCMMSAGQCHFCKPARTQIFKMQSEGMSDSAIIASFVMEYGQKIFRPDPNSYFWVIPYLALALGGLAMLYTVRRMMGHQQPMRPVSASGAPVADDPELARYRDAIEKDTARLD